MTFYNVITNESAIFAQNYKNWDCNKNVENLPDPLRVIYKKDIKIRTSMRDGQFLRQKCKISVNKITQKSKFLTVVLKNLQKIIHFVGNFYTWTWWPWLSHLWQIVDLYTYNIVWITVGFLWFLTKQNFCSSCFDDRLWTLYCSLFVWSALYPHS